MSTEPPAALRIQKPARYVGNEVNVVKKDIAEVRLRVALAFPDAYEVGMSHLGLKILYSVLNARPELYAERVYAPWPDKERQLRLRNEPLTTLETNTPVREVDIVGFSLQYELCATSVLQMLDLASIPLRAHDRTAADPFVVGGGPVTSNPLPLSPFFDAFAIGDGEELILELAEAHLAWKQSGAPREDLLRAWKRVPGLFVPLLHEQGETVQRRILADLNTSEHPVRPLLPHCEIVHDRLGVEITRGCTRGCRFCQAGMLYRPVRERNADAVVELALRGLAETGWDEVALLSLSTGDYSHIGALIQNLTSRFESDKVALSLPSLRTDTFSSEMAEQIRKVRKTGFTLAPEAGTDRLRRIINKGNSEEDLHKAVESAFASGWQSVKLYFMMGLPFEEPEDLEGIVDLIHKAAGWAKGGKITASVSTFVPKSHTPFQWARQLSITETEERQREIGRHFRRGRTQVKFHDPKVSFLEGVLARGDERLAEVIEQVFRRGARFDGWDDQLQFGLWMEVFRDLEIDPETYLATRPINEPLLWDFVETGVSKEFLVEEWNKAQRHASTGDCRFEGCVGCGVCDFETIRPVLGEPLSAAQMTEHAAAGPTDQAGVRRFRLRYGKGGEMRFVGHQDLIRVFHRAFRRAGLRLAYSQGFHPHPKLRFSPPLAVGVESRAEFLDFDLVNAVISPDEVLASLQAALPCGLESEELLEIPWNEPPLSARIQQLTYEIELTAPLSTDDALRRIEEFRSAGRVDVVKVLKGKRRSRDLKPLVSEIALRGTRLAVTLKSGPDGTAHPIDAFAAILNLPRDDVEAMRIVKTSAEFQCGSTTSEEAQDGQ